MKKKQRKKLENSLIAVITKILKGKDADPSNKAKPAVRKSRKSKVKDFAK